MVEAKRPTLEYAFEGIDGAGKTTNIKKLEEHYRQQGFRVVVLRGLSSSWFGQVIRHNIQELNERGENGVRVFKYDILRTYRGLDGAEADLIFWDRHLYSIFAANSITDCNLIRQIPPVIPEPPKVFLMEVSPEVAWRREQAIAAEATHPLSLEWLVGKHERYLRLLESEPERFYKIDASSPIDQVFGQLVEIINKDLRR